MLRLHDDEAHGCSWIDRRDEKIDVTKHPSSGFVQHEITQATVVGDPSRLFPDRGAGWSFDASDDDVSDLALCMARDDINRTETLASGFVWLGGYRPGAVWRTVGCLVW